MSTIEQRLEEYVNRSEVQVNRQKKGRRRTVGPEGIVYSRMKEVNRKRLDDVIKNPRNLELNAQNFKSIDERLEDKLRWIEPNNRFHRLYLFCLGIKAVIGDKEKGEIYLTRNFLATYLDIQPNTASLLFEILSRSYEGFRIEENDGRYETKARKLFVIDVEKARGGLEKLINWFKQRIMYKIIGEKESELLEKSIYNILNKRYLEMKEEMEIGFVGEIKSKRVPDRLFHAKTRIGEDWYEIGPKIRG